MVAVRILRNASACALPRPSAMASAKLANRQVNQSQRVIWRLNPENRWSRNAVERMAPIQTTNMTGFLSSSRGCSFWQAPSMAWRISSEYLISIFALIVM